MIIWMFNQKNQQKLNHYVMNPDMNIRLREGN